MDFFSILIIAIGLAMDCFAIAISTGVCSKKFNARSTFLMAFLFGFFQGGMPLISYFAGISFSEFITKIDHWISFGLLIIIGGKMIWDSLSKQDSENCEDKKEQKNMTFSMLLSLALATSIDAFATGIIFIPFPHYIWEAVGIIGIVSFIFVCLGMWIGITFGKRFKLNVNLIGGIILIFIGIKILIEHLFF